MWAPEWIAPAAAQGGSPRAAEPGASSYDQARGGGLPWAIGQPPRRPPQRAPGAQAPGQTRRRAERRPARPQTTHGRDGELPGGGAASRLQSGPVSQRTDLEDRRNPVARGRQPAASQFSGRLAKGAIPDFDKFLDDRLLWLHTNVGRHDNRGNNVVTHRNCLPKSRTRAFFSGNTHEYKIFTDQGGFSGSAGPLTLILTRSSRTWA